MFPRASESAIFGQQVEHGAVFTPPPLQHLVGSGVSFPGKTWPGAVFLGQGVAGFLICLFAHSFQ